MFEVGKKYINNSSHICGECIFVGFMLTILREESASDRGQEFVVLNSSFEHWKEYKEPQRGRKYCAISQYTYKGSEPILSSWNTENERDNWLKYSVKDLKIKVLSLFEIDWVEGKGLKDV